MTDDPGFTVSDDQSEAVEEGASRRRGRRDDRALILSDFDFCRTPDGRALVGVPHTSGHREWHICPGQGIRQELVTRYYNRDTSDRAALEVDDVAQAVLALLEAECGAWKGSPAELYRRLCDLTSERITRSPLWPKNAAGLGNKLTRLAPGLRRVHRIETAHGKGGADGSRWWSVRRL